MNQNDRDSFYQLIEYFFKIMLKNPNLKAILVNIFGGIMKCDVIAEGERQGKSVCVCGETAGDVTMTRLLLGLGLRSFSMHPSQILAVKQQVLRSDTAKLKVLAQNALQAEEPARALVG